MTEAAAITTNETATTEQPQTLLGGVTQTQEQGASANDWLPEKHRVAKEDGSVDIEASAKKLAETYRALEKRMGAGDIPPKTPEEYEPAITVEGFDFETIKADPLYQGFLKSAHAKGMTNDQVSFVLDEFLTRQQNIVQGGQVLDAKQTEEALRQVWASESEYTANLQASYKALTTLAGDDAERLVSKYGNDPDIIQLLAKVGHEMREDSPPPQLSVPDGLDFSAKVAELQDQINALPKNDPRRMKLLQEKDELYARKYGNKPANSVMQVTRQ